MPRRQTGWDTGPDGAARPDRDAPAARAPARRREPPAGPGPDAANLREAALAHLARFSSTEANLVRVLQRRIGRWAQRAAREGQPAEAVASQVARAREAAVEVARAMVAMGVVDDAAFAAARARRLSRAGRSRRAVAAHLAAKGVAPGTAGELLETGEVDELAAALAHLRRRRQGPFATAAATPADGGDPAARLRALAGLARAGFPREVAEAALDTDPDEAEARLIAARRD
ncbi:RecX family transcriptional regulator [Roseomonas sp. OT10]|uniref:RecX family transcriptional regulator n=1 Tax=Roseomonas cutis TaxID=2897332 RepID=UPI001E330E4C|nr:RecX family transcriptional regulator [Roseomonas sp. OT10]UFN47011.1 RecX family transcriptional regulator [Roseomonas sp. OT10]